MMDGCCGVVVYLAEMDMSMSMDRREKKLI